MACYVISDIHGEYEQFMALLKAVRFQAEVPFTFELVWHSPDYPKVSVADRQWFV